MYYVILTWYRWDIQWWIIISLDLIFVNDGCNRVNLMKEDDGMIMVMIQVLFLRLEPWSNHSLWWRWRLWCLWLWLWNWWWLWKMYMYAMSRMLLFRMGRGTYGRVWHPTWMLHGCLSFQTGLKQAQEGWFMSRAGLTIVSSSFRHRYHRHLVDIGRCHPYSLLNADLHPSISH